MVLSPVFLAHQALSTRMARAFHPRRAPRLRRLIRPADLARLACLPFIFGLPARLAQTGRPGLVARLSLLTLLVLTAASAAPVNATPAISLDHLNLLKGTIETPAGPLPVWYIYAEPTAAGYRPVGAAGEGISCVDDVARALLVYLEHYELTGDTSSLDHARDAISFLAYTRQSDGTYANFVDDRGRLNLTGITSRPGINWWMARAMWGLAKALVVFESIDPGYARSISHLLAPSVDKLAQTVRASVRGSDPGSVIVGGGADVSAIFLMAISLLHTFEPDPELEQIATALALGLRSAQAGDAATPPYRAVMPNPGSPAVWTGWGSHGMEALAMAGIVFGRPEWVSWAAESAHALGSYLVAGPGSLAAQGPAPFRYPQIAYDQSPLVRGLAWLLEATGNPLYSDLAFLGASWLFGNNPAGEPMHHLASGRTFDGIDGDGWRLPGRINYSSGAESTIEGLSMLLALRRMDANGLLHDAFLSRPRGVEPIVFEAEAHLQPLFGRLESHRQDHLAGSRPSGGAYIIMHDGVEVKLTLPHSAVPGGRYRLDLVHGGARSSTVTLYAVAGEELLTAIDIRPDARGDLLRTSHLGELVIGKTQTEMEATTKTEMEAKSIATVRFVVEGGPIALDAILLHPVVMWRHLEGAKGDVLALRNTTDEMQSFTLPLEDVGAIELRLYDQSGQPVDIDWADSKTLRIPPFGFGVGVSVESAT